MTRDMSARTAGNEGARAEVNKPQSHGGKG